MNCPLGGEDLSRTTQTKRKFEPKPTEAKNPKTVMRKIQKNSEKRSKGNNRVNTTSANEQWIIDLKSLKAFSQMTYRKHTVTDKTPIDYKQ